MVLIGQYIASVLCLACCLLWLFNPRKPQLDSSTGFFTVLITQHCKHTLAGNCCREWLLENNCQEVSVRTSIALPANLWLCMCSQRSIAVQIGNLVINTHELERLSADTEVFLLLYIYRSKESYSSTSVAPSFVPQQPIGRALALLFLFFWNDKLLC